MSWIYPAFLLAVSALVMLAERLWPWRREQKQMRPALWSDAVHLVFNGHFLGLIFFGVASYHLLPHIDHWLAGHGWTDVVYRNAAADWPLWIQIPIALFAIDFVQWCVHNLLHRVPFFWRFHETHHSVKDGEMDWIVSFRFQWTEVVVYRAVQYLPLAWFGFGEVAIMVHATFGTLIGHLNHSNLDLGHGRWRYILNSPRMHIWHHDYDRGGSDTVNFGIIFSVWDWLFGTAYMPDHSPRKLGYPGVEEHPRDFFSQAIWPMQRWLPALAGHRVLSMGLGAALVVFAWFVATGGLVRSPTPMFGEEQAASQPFDPRVRLDGAYADTPEEATAALKAFGSEARAAGWTHPEAAVSVAELARGLGSPKLVLLDVRPLARVAAGHIPTARQVERKDYSVGDPAPGVSKDASGLQALLRDLGVRQSDTVVLYGDGGPEPYRLWWTLRARAGFEARVLDGGLAAWKAAGHGLAGGEPKPVTPGDVALTPAAAPAPHLWADIEARLRAPGAVLVDTRSRDEYTGAVQHPKAARAGRIPGAKHLDWRAVLGEHDRLLAPDALDALVAPLGITPGAPVITACQSGTRSSALFYALHQRGWTPERLANYDGSWAEYSRLAHLPVATGET